MPKHHLLLCFFMTFLVIGCTATTSLVAAAADTKIDGAKFKQLLDKEVVEQTKDMNLVPIAGHEARGWCYYELGQYDKAIDDYSEAIRLSGLKRFLRRPIGAAYIGRASAYKALNKYDEALSDYQQAQRADTGVFLSWPQFFMALSGLLVIIGFMLVVISIKLFGPKGLLSILGQRQMEKAP
jgi:tetratricopeptide (TPR) repeat protein